MFLIHAFVIDDDQDTIKKMEAYSTENPDMITIVGSAKSIATSQHALSQLQPDLIIVRATKNNFSHLESLRAFDFSVKYICMGVKEDAYQAFKLEAVDFLVFPFDADEFTSALLKVKYAIEREAAFVKLKNTTFSAGFLGHANKDFFVVSSIDKIEIIKFTEVLYCKADGKYTEIFLQNGTKIVSSKNIGEYQQLFPSHYFFRIHNSTLINVHHIVRINKKDGLYCELNNGQDLPVAKRKEREFLLYLREN
jgi:two-component system, LytTR family, response regulator